VYPQIGVQQTSFGGDAAQQGLKQALKTKTVDPEQVNQIVSNFARRRGVTDPTTINQLTQKMTDWIEFGRAGGITADELIAELERQYPKLASKVPVQPPAQEPAARLSGPGAKTARNPAQPQMTAEVLGRERR
jgi:hypothetical protein